MKISTKGRYALRLMIDLAHMTQAASIRCAIFPSDSRFGQVSGADRGAAFACGLCYLDARRTGGYQLARHPSEYTVGDILRITEGSLAPVACLEHEPVDCPRVDECITLSFWRGLYDAINNYVDSVTLEDLVNNGTLNFSI
mgnify:CR=1 FL=1